MPVPLKTPHACPRCGYDLEGVIGTWKESCPLDGLCTECGLDFAWSDVLNPVRRIPSWFLEHPHRPVWRTLVGTYARVFAPLRFWRTIQLFFPIRLGRLAVFVVFALLAFHVLLGYANLAHVNGIFWPGMMWRQSSDLWMDSVTRITAWPYASWTLEDSMRRGGRPINSMFDAGWFIILLSMVLTPLQFFLLRRSMRAAKVRPTHLLRVGVYSLGALPVLFAAYVFVAYGWSWARGSGTVGAASSVGFQDRSRGRWRRSPPFRRGPSHVRRCGSCCSGTPRPSDICG